MSEEQHGRIKKAAQVVLAGGGIVYGVMVPAYFFEIFEQKRVAQAAYERAEREIQRVRSEAREDLHRAIDGMDKRLERIEAKIDRLPRR